MTDIRTYKDVAAAFFAYHGLIKHTLFENCVGLTKSQAMMMSTIRELEPINMGTLAQRIAVSKEQATRAIQPLVEAGFVERSHDETNRRMVNVTLTSAGAALLKEHYAAVDTLIQQQLSSLSDEEQAQLIEASATATALLHKALGDRCHPPQR